MWWNVARKTWTLIWSAKGCFHLKGCLSASEQTVTFLSVPVIFSYESCQQALTWYHFWLHSFGSFLRCWCRQTRWEIHYDIRSPIPEAPSWPKAMRLRRTNRRRGNQLSVLSHSGHAFHCFLSFCILHGLSFSWNVTVIMSNFSHDVQRIWHFASLSLVLNWSEHSWVFPITVASFSL